MSLRLLNNRPLFRQLQTLIKKPQVRMAVYSIQGFICRCNPERCLSACHSLVLSQIFSSLDLGADSKRRQSRPQWATQSTMSFPSKDPEQRMTSVQWNAGIRPSPVRNPVPRLTEKSLRASLRSHRSTPSEDFYYMYI